MITYPPRASLEQRRHVMRLTAMAGMLTFKQTFEWISGQIGRPVNNITELTAAEASQLIAVLKNTGNWTSQLCEQLHRRRFT